MSDEKQQLQQQQGEELVLLERMRELSKTRELTRAQSEVVALAFCNYNLLLRGPANSGKRYIARRAGDLIALRKQRTETVEIMSKWFTVTATGQIIIDEASLKVGIEQIQRATVLIIENVPCHPQAAAAFFAHLDFICKVERAKCCSARSTPSPAQSSFGGIQIIATQNDAADDPSPQVLWTTKPNQPTNAATNPNTAAAAASSSASHSSSASQSSSCGAGPPVPTRQQQMGLLVTAAAHPASNPHPDVFVVLFR